MKTFVQIIVGGEKEEKSAGYIHRIRNLDDITAILKGRNKGLSNSEKK